MDINKEKNIIRKQIKYLKSKLNADEKLLLSKSIILNLENNNDFINSTCILAYWSMNDEVNTHAFVQKWSSSKDIYLPVIKGDMLEFRLFTDINKLEKGSQFGIYEPKGEILKDYKTIDLAIIPGVAFDNHNNRLGRGRAFYDKILKSIDTIKIGICFNFQILDIIPTENTDIKMDMIISSKP